MYVHFCWYIKRTGLFRLQDLEEVKSELFGLFSLLIYYPNNNLLNIISLTLHICIVLMANSIYTFRTQLTELVLTIFLS